MDTKMDDTVTIDVVKIITLDTCEVINQESIGENLTTNTEKDDTVTKDVLKIITQDTSNEITNQDTVCEDLNPLNRLPEELFDLIFQQLTFKDILTLSLVSPQWHDFTSNSYNCMKRIQLKVVWLHVNPVYIQRDMFELIRRSQRKYQHFYFFCNSSTIVSEGCLKILQAHAKSVVNIVSFDMISDPKTQEMNSFTMPKLVFLNIREIVHKEYNIPNLILLQANKQLKRVKLDIGVNEHVIECLNNEHLIQLDITHAMVESIFKNDVSGIFKFKLKEFCVNTQKMDQLMEENFTKFLSTQANSLLSLQLCSVSCNVMNFIFDSMSKLRYLKFNSVRGREIVLNDKKNKSILYINMQLEYRFETIKKVLEAAPNVREVYVPRVTVEMNSFFDVMKQKGLKKVHCQCRCLVSVKNNYDLKFLLSVLDINKT